MANILETVKRKYEDAKDELNRIRAEQKQAEAEAKKLMTEEELKKCKAVIHSASALCAAEGIIPLPGVDAVPISFTQVGMIVKLGSIFNQRITDTAAKAAISAAAATFVGRTAVKVIPGVGWAVSGAVAGAVTETIGWLVANDLAKSTKRADRCVDVSDDADANDAISEKITTLPNRAQAFLSGEKNSADSRAEYNALLKDFEDILNSIPSNHELRKMYDDLCDLL